MSLIPVVLVVASCSGVDGDPNRSESESVAPAAISTVFKPTPVLGRDGYQQYASGFGTVKPDSISMSSTASSTFGGITWESWGGEDAVATSRSQQSGASDPQSELWLMASDLGWCNGVWSYRSLSIAGERSALGTGVESDICAGDRSEP